MRRSHSRAAAFALAVATCGLAAFALKPAASTPTATLASRNPAVEIRTQVIRRTIHVIRHEPGAPLRGSRGVSAIVVAGHAHAHARTAASGKHHAPIGAPVAAVATRASGGHGASTGHTTTGSGVPVTTRSSASRSTAASPPATSHPVSTRSSGSHSAAISTPATSHPVSTRSSGGGHKHGEDGGDGHGGGDD